MEDSIPRRLRRLAAMAGADPLLTLLFPDQPPRSFTFGELLTLADGWAGRFQTAGLQPGDGVVVILQHGPDLYAAYLGALLGGWVPAQFAPPSAKFAHGDYCSAIVTLLTNARAAALVTSPALAGRLAGIGERVPTLRQVCTAPESAAPSTPLAVPKDPRRPVLMQFTSGTTGLKKGMVLSEAAVLWQVDRYARAIGLGPHDRIVSWLPLYHDMGLLACFFLPLLTGTPLVALSPFDWVADPARLLQAVSHYRGTLTWMPNFAFALLADRVTDDRLTGIDLSCWRGVINCSEPVRPGNMADFQKRFSPFGLQDTALGVSYAMAENTFAVTSGGVGRSLVLHTLDQDCLAREGRAVPHPQGRRVASSGRPLPDTRISILDDRGNPLPDGHLGEIGIHSPGLFDGYLGTAGTTDAFLPNGLFRTGDLGYLEQGELFVLGRRQDTLIIGGANLFPQDIEALADGVPGVVPGRTAAFGIDDDALGTQALVVLAETREQDPKRRRSIRQALFERITAGSEATPRDVRVLDHMILRKSTSGKISRNLNRQRYLDGGFGPLVPTAGPMAAAGATASATTLEGVMACVREILAMARPDLVRELQADTPLFSSGLIDSFARVTLITGLEQAFGRSRTPGLLAALERLDTIRALADHLDGAAQDAQAPANDAAALPPALARKYRLVPQMADAERQPYEWTAYLMRRGAAHYRSPSLTSDAWGFRTVLGRHGPVTLEAFHAHRGPRGLVLGNSTAYGVGTSGDQAVLASRLNRMTDALWFNFSQRASSMTQERLAVELHAPLEVDHLVWVSGINNLIAVLLDEGEPTNPAPFVGERYFLKVMNPDRNAAGEHPDLQQRLQGMVRTLDRELGLLAAAFRPHGTRLLYCLQPALSWIDKPLTAEEVELVGLFDGMASPVQRAHHPEHLAPWRAFYSRTLATLCRRHGLKFIDCNQDPALAGNAWLFVDRTHLTDQGHGLLAERIGRWVAHGRDRMEETL
ncbi:MAG: AMP-binding protein [Magnetococcales bacterium]|nr:AMP-binding protein [Magnetococcales bacterium]